MSDEEFKNAVQSALTAIHNRIRWHSIALLAMLGILLALTTITLIRVNHLEYKLKNIEKAIDDASKAQNKPAPAEPLLYLKNGLSDAQRAEFYHLAEGSEIFPLTWMQVLKTANGKFFLDDVARLGFLPDTNNKDGLPIGLTSGVTIGLEPLGPMVGLNCAACHVGELHYQGKRVRIDGAPNLLNTREFFKTLIDAALATAQDPAELIAFLARVKEREEKNAGTNPSKASLFFARKLLVKTAQKGEAALKAVIQPSVENFIKQEFESDPLDLQALLKDGEKDEDKFRAKIVKGFKLDGLADMAHKIPLIKDWADDVEKNSTLTRTLHEFILSIRLLRARAVFLQKLGPVGKNPRTNWGPGRVDAFGSARTFLFDPQSEPINPVSYPPIFNISTHDWFHYDNNTTTFLERNFGQALGVGALYAKAKDGTIYSTLQPRNLIRLENLAAQLTPPQWPVEVFGKIDQDRAQRGANLYAKYCAACHDATKDDPTFARLMDLDVIKTDPARATSFAAPLPDKTPFPVAIKALLFDLKTKEIADFPPDEKAKLEKMPVAWLGPAKYAARSIKGVWATPPYLHNGSVANMDELLQPAAARRPFFVGSHQYDVEKLGYVSDEKTTLFDTTIPGNFNAGHEGEKYGTNISPDERKDLLEFLKTQ